MALKEIKVLRIFYNVGVQKLKELIHEKDIIKGIPGYQHPNRNKLIKLADQEMDYDDKFRLYMTSRLANPHFSPELAAKSTIIDFTVT